MNQHTSENRALIEELKQDLIVNSILEEQVKQQSSEYILKGLKHSDSGKELAMQVEN